MSAPYPFTITIGGQAGQGIKSSGLTLAKFASRSGFFIHTYTEFPSLIRGGHNVIQIAVSREEINCPLQKTDVLIALNQDTINRHAASLTKGGMVIFDGEKNIDTSVVRQADVRFFPLPLSGLANAAGNSELLINTVSLAAAVTLLGGDLSILEELIREEFADKSPDIIDSNLAAVRSGSEIVTSQFSGTLSDTLAKSEDAQPRMVVNGAQAIALGAIAGGVQFAAIYPMSPISGILSVLAQYQEQYGYIYKQPEDEISAIHMAIGAGFTGARSMTSTSGGGFCLMTEGFGLAGMAETPLVIVEGMRPGPATGLPTWSGQGDLQFVLHAHQGEFPRIVLAAGDVVEAFTLTRQAFNLAEKYQTPVTVLVDKNILDDDWSCAFFSNSDFTLTRGKLTTDFNPEYTRYAVEGDGVSFRSLPGTGNYFLANSDEHDPTGYSSEESETAVAQQTKRMYKLDTCRSEDMPEPALYGPENADITIVSWGSNKGAILQALRDFPQVNYLHLTWMNPFPVEVVSRILKASRYVIGLEANVTGQLANLIAEKTGIIITDRFLKIDGRPFFPSEIISKINSVLSK